MSSSVWFFLAASLGLGFTLNAAFPRRGPKLLLPSWIAAFLTIDLPFHHIAWQLLSLPLWAWFGAFETNYGQLGLLILWVSWVGMMVIWWPARKARPMVHELAEKLQLKAVAPVPGNLLFKPFSRLRPGVECLRDIGFCEAAGQTLKLDVYRSETDATGRPVLLYLHGGGWMYGDKKDQGLPLCNHMATLGWVCFNANYRLAPAATWPEPLSDAKSAIAWIRQHAHEYGADPSFIAIAGNSAGGHIASMAALTPDVRSANAPNTTIQAVVPSYGVYDLTNRLQLHNPEFISGFIGQKLIKADFDKEPEKFTAASPRDQASKANQPWLIIQGTADTLAPLAEARDFFNALREESPASVFFAEFPAAQHGFDGYYCHRALAAVELSARFLVTAYNGGLQKPFAAGKNV